MVQRLKETADLLVLKLSMTEYSVDDAGTVEFCFERGGETIGKIEASAAEIGLPKRLDDSRESAYQPPWFELPREVFNFIHDLAGEHLSARDALWLQFGSPRGNLALVPWESLLHKGVAHAILRLPYFATRPYVALDSFDVLLCASSPAAKVRMPLDRMLKDYVDHIRKAAPPDRLIHVFTDARVYPAVTSAFRLYPDVIVYNPERAGRFAPATQGETANADALERMENPWLQWMREALLPSGRYIDVAHFVGHARLSAGQGALALAESPVVNADRAWARFLGAGQLTNFLTNIGAWSAGFTSPEHNYSTFGLRLLADQVAQARPGPVFLHDANQDREGKCLDNTYRFLFQGISDAPSRPPRSEAISLYCHPASVASAAEHDASTDALVQRFTLANTQTRDLLQEGAPEWVVSSQRGLEQSVAQLLEPAASAAPDAPRHEEAEAQRRGAEKALSELTDIIARHARLSGNGSADRTDAHTFAAQLKVSESAYSPEENAGSGVEEVQ